MLFRDEESGPIEPVKGLPQPLPEGETILWQGQPTAKGLLFSAFRIRWLWAYILVATVWRLSALSVAGATAGGLFQAVIVSLGAAALATLILGGIAYGMSRAALFTLTSERIVMRHGIALRKYFNLPFDRMVGAQLKRHGSVGDIALEITGPHRIGYLHLWPFARPFRYGQPVPMLRAIETPDHVSRLLAEAVAAKAPETTQITEATDAPRRSTRPARTPASAAGTV
ncbi:MAG: photosynthetic complex putative assembly protein PuhB [Pseudomonadota bacterium]